MAYRKFPVMKPMPMAIAIMPNAGATTSHQLTASGGLGSFG